MNRRAKKIMLVEDEPVTAKLEAKELRGRGYEVILPKRQDTFNSRFHENY